MILENLKANGSKFDNALDATEYGVDQIKREFKIGDITWMKIRRSTWWPAQVFDEKNVNYELKKKGKNDVLVRLYGTQEYYYVNPVKCNSEFEHAVKENNSTSKAAFRKALEEDISLMKSDGTPNGNGKRKRQKKDVLVIDPENDEAAEAQTPPSSLRRIKVMRSLGLIAPEGSPFGKISFLQQ